jgi:hypothetical protein
LERSKNEFLFLNSHNYGLAGHVVSLLKKSQSDQSSPLMGMRNNFSHFNVYTHRNGHNHKKINRNRNLIVPVYGVIHIMWEIRKVIIFGPFITKNTKIKGTYGTVQIMTFYVSIFLYLWGPTDEQSSFPKETVQRSVKPHK